MSISGQPPVRCTSRCGKISAWCRRGLARPLPCGPARPGLARTAPARQRGPGTRPGEQAQLVCDEMARRARHNVEVIIERLTGAGYRFHTNNDAQDPVTPHVPPSAGAAALAGWLAERFGPVPMTLLSWIRLAGDVWLVGTHPQWPESASADPLVIEAGGSRYPGDPIRGYFDSEHDTWRRRAARDPEQAGLFVLPLSPDRVHKENVSGGALRPHPPRRLRRRAVRRRDHDALRVLPQPRLQPRRIPRPDTASQPLATKASPRQGPPASLNRAPSPVPR
jgi:hypothetical protein